jgi:hypothetical protein
MILGKKFGGFMLFRNNKLLFLGIIGFAFLSGCARYKAQPLNKLATQIPSKNKQSILLTSRVFSKSDCKKFLGRNVIRKGYQPIHITITNNTNRYLNISKSNISLPCVSVMNVTKKVHTSTAGRAVGYGIASLIIWPMAIPAIVDGIGSSQANQKLDQDFLNKELCDQVICPFNTITGLIFVPVEKFDSKFSITLVDAQSDEHFTLTTSKPIANI